jgi:hypothetical protein
VFVSTSLLMSDVQYARTLSNGRILKNSPRIGKKNKKIRKKTFLFARVYVRACTCACALAYIIACARAYIIRHHRD